jgi:hypothetical protein
MDIKNSKLGIMINTPSNTKIKVTDFRGNLEIEVPWDADIDDWRAAFTTILTYKEFHRDTIYEMFDNEE